MAGFVEYQCSVGCAGLRKKGFVIVAVDVCQGEKQVRIAQMCVVAGLVFNIVKNSAIFAQHLEIEMFN